MKERLKKARIHFGLSQEGLAAKLGVKRQTVSTWELGTSNISQPMVRVICDELGISETWLTQGEGPMIPEPETFSLEEFIRNHGCTDLEEQILRAYFAIDGDRRQRFLAGFLGGLLHLPGAAARPKRQPSPAIATDEEIAEEVRNYQEELIEEKRAAEKSAASGDGSGREAAG